METEKDMRCGEMPEGVAGKAWTHLPRPHPLTHRPSAEGAGLGAGQSLSGQAAHSPWALARPGAGS